MLEIQIIQLLSGLRTILTLYGGTSVSIGGAVLSLKATNIPQTRCLLDPLLFCLVLEPRWRKVKTQLQSTDIVRFIFQVRSLPASYSSGFLLGLLTVPCLCTCLHSLCDWSLCYRYPVALWETADHVRNSSTMDGILTSPGEGSLSLVQGPIVYPQTVTVTS